MTCWGMLVVALLLATAQPAADQHWPQFRGPAGRAIADGAELPDSWSADENVTWAVTIGMPDVPSPLVYRGRLYSIFDDGILNVFDTRTGQRVYRKRVGGGGSGFSASPLAADGKVYLLSEEGDTFVIAAGDSYEELAVNGLDELAFASPAVADGALFIRTMTKLYRIEATP